MADEAKPHYSHLVTLLAASLDGVYFAALEDCQMHGRATISRRSRPHECVTELVFQGFAYLPSSRVNAADEIGAKTLIEVPTRRGKLAVA